MDTKEKIMDVALHMFSERGYEATSIRDICGKVGIKESTLYYHFKNKHDILDSLIFRFENHIAGLLENIDMPGSGNNGSDGGNLLDQYMMNSYLFDPFCNLMLRLMMIEQFHNVEIRELYEQFMFTRPYEIHKNILNQFVLAGLVSESDAEWVAQEFFSFMTMITYKYLLNGELTEERKTAYSQEVHRFYSKAIERLSGMIGGK